jgi:hypothetical protein
MTQQAEQGDSVKQKMLTDIDVAGDIDLGDLTQKT